MARDLTAGMQTAVEAQTLIFAFLVEIETSAGFIRLWTGIGTYEWPVGSPVGTGTLWTGVGWLGSISDIGETTDATAMGITLSLSGIPAAMVTAALDELIPGKAGIVRMALFSGSTIIIDPYKSFAGRVDAVDMVEGGDTCTISVFFESREIDLQFATEYRWTDQDQKINWPADTGFQFVETLQELNINWGAADQPIPQKQG